MDRATLKANAKAQLKGKWGNAAVATLIVMIVAGGVSGGSSFYSQSAGVNYTLSISFSLVGALVSVILSYGLMFYTYEIAKGNTVSVGDVFWSFKAGNRILLAVLIYVFTLLWTLLFIIPGIIAGYRYRLAPYILMDNPGMTASEAINMSKLMTKGHKMDLFVLDLSFIGWGILAGLTCGIGTLWLAPYMHTTLANFYLSLPAPSNQ